jgi:hypothetical protein
VHPFVCTRCGNLVFFSDKFSFFFLTRSHFPVTADAPATADPNILRLQDMKEAQEARQKKRREQARAARNFGRTDPKTGKTSFTGEELSKWQLQRYETWKSADTAKEIYEEKLSLEEWSEQTENLQLGDPRLTEAVFREEIFEPGSSQRTVARFSAKLPPSSPFSDKNVSARRLSTGSALTNVSETESKQAARALGAAMLATGFAAKARRRKGSAKETREEILDEVAV